MSPLLTVDEVADHLRLRPKTVRAYARDGRIPGARKVGASWRFEPDELRVLPPERPPAEPIPLQHPRLPNAARRPRAGSGAEALRAALERPIVAPRTRGGR